MTSRNEKVAAALTMGSEVVLGATAAAVEMHTPGAAVALAAALPAASGLAARAWDMMCGVAAARSRMDAQQVIDLLISDPNGLRLLSAAIEAVRVAPYDEKVRLLGNSLAIGAADSTQIDDEMLVVVAITNLEPYHLRLLRAGDELGRRGKGNGHWNSTVAHEVDSALTSDRAETLVGVLVGHGLVQRLAGTTGISAYQLTSLGELVLRRVREAADVDVTPDPFS